MKRMVAGLVSAGLCATGCSAMERLGPDGSEGAAMPPVVTNVTLPPFSNETLPSPTTIETTAATLPETTLESTTTSTTTTTTTTVPLDVFNPDCIRIVQPGDTVSAIAKEAGQALGRTVTVSDIQIENNKTSPDLIYAGELLDVCYNPPESINDITGEVRVVPTTVPTTVAETPPPNEVKPTATTTTVAPPPPETVPTELPSGVSAQQTQLNNLLTPYGFPALETDGLSGPLTEQALCAARVALSLSVSRADMEPGSEEERALMSASELPVPSAPAVGSPKWGLVDQTCQVMFLGEGEGSLSYVFQVSTGEPEFATRNDTKSAHRYDPAVDNNGWHNSADYPASQDNPLNGNMYLPVYINGNQAIHGANNVPLEPASHGCVRMHLGNQDTMIDWLGIGHIQEETWDLSRHVNFRVTTQGSY